MFFSRRYLGFMGIVAALSGCGGKSTTIIYVLVDASAMSTVASDASAGAGGSSGSLKPAPTVTEACQALCDRLVRANCVHADCAPSCVKAVANTSCSDVYVKFLTCALTPDFVCDNGVADLANKACLDEKNAFYQCRNGTTPTNYPPAPDAMDPFPPPDDDAGVPVEAGTPTACPDIPSLPDTATCSGEDAGPSDAEVFPVCPRTCGDGLGNEWHSECNGGKCLCFYNGKERCTSPCPQKPYECGPDCCF